MDNGFIPDNWKPEPPAEIGSGRWKDDIAFQHALQIFPSGFPDGKVVVAIPDYRGHSIGYFCIQKKSSGWDYFRADLLIPRDA